MKHVLLLPVVSFLLLQGNGPLLPVAKSKAAPNYLSLSLNTNNEPSINLQSEEKMLAVVFKKQEFCRAEVKDFEEFETQFRVVSARVYFTGTNFRSPESGVITSNSLKPLKSLMDRCAAGTIVIFDNVKVIGPDNLVRPIAGTSFVLF